jgi:hypothetical protein
MNESTCSSKFQTDLRQALPTAEVIKHADKSMIGMVDASVTACKQPTLWIEYKFIGPKTKGVNAAAFMKSGSWCPHDVAMASPTQYAKARRLAAAGRCVYLFWVLDPFAIRKRVRSVVMWHPITEKAVVMENTAEAVFRISQLFKPDGSPVPELFKEFFNSL